jgi:hypothetical protein
MLLSFLLLKVITSVRVTAPESRFVHFPGFYRQLDPRVQDLRKVAVVIRLISSETTEDARHEHTFCWFSTAEEAARLVTHTAAGLRKAALITNREAPLNRDMTNWTHLWTQDAVWTSWSHGSSPTLSVQPAAPPSFTSVLTPQATRRPKSGDRLPRGLVDNSLSSLHN